MTAWLGYAPAERHHPFNPTAKNVDEGPKTQVFSATTLSGLGYLGHGAAREIVLRNVASAERASADSADRILVADVPPLSAGDETFTNLADLTPEEGRAAHAITMAHVQAAFENDRAKQATELADISEEEEAKWSSDREDKRSVTDRLPKAFGDFLRKMPEWDRRRRESAILKKFGEWRQADEMPFTYFDILDMDAFELADAASTAAWKHSNAYPADDFSGSDHRKRRCEKWWRKRLGRLQKRAMGYVEAVTQAVGGPNVRGRPLNVSDYTLSRFREHRDRTREIMTALVLIQKNDPSVQIPMLQVDANARSAKAAKMRLWIDMNLKRWGMLGWRVCWITVTLPGKYVCHSTNETTRASKHDLNLGPDEAMQEIQDRHHRVMALLRSRELRPQGWWFAQPQQSGTVHRHYLIAVPTLEDARAVCDGFRGEFSSLEDRDGEGEDRGCDASVIGDDDPRYKTRKGKDGKEETAASIAKYTARYSSRCEELGGDAGADGDEADDGREDKDRFAAWKWLRGARTHAWLGLDSSRAPGEIWDTLWAHLKREEGRIEQSGKDDFHYPDDVRMMVALREMRECSRCVGRAVEIRQEKAAAADELEAAEIEELAQIESAQAAQHAWHAAIAAGIWPDRDLAPQELDWLRGETMDETGEVDALPPYPLREARESVYEETRQEVVGVVGAVERFRVSAKPKRIELLEAAAAVGLDVWQGKTAGFIVKELKQAGFRFSKRPDGSLAGFDLSGEILLRHTEEWEIVDEEAAKARVEEWEQCHEPLWPDSSTLTTVMQMEPMTPPKERVWPDVADVQLGLEKWYSERESAGLRERVSFSPTDPSYRPSASLGDDDRPPG